jgi:hypothetical protein
MTDRAIRLSPVELLAAWEALDLGDPPFLLRLRRPAGTEAGRREAHRQLRAALAELAARGLASRRLADGRLTDRGLADCGLADRGLADRGLADYGLADYGLAAPLVGALDVLGRAPYHLDIRFAGPDGRPRLGLGAQLGARGVVVLSADGVGPVELITLDASRVPSTLISQLGPVRAGTAAPVNLPAGLLTEAAGAVPDGNPWALADRLVANGVPPVEAAAVARVCAPNDLAGQLGATSRGERGIPQRRGPWVIGFVRTASGYFLQLRRGNTVTMGPADPARLLRHWAELVAHLPAPAH